MSVQTVTRPTATTLSRAGAWCLAAGIVGAVQAAVLLAWKDQVPDTRFSRPFTGTGFTVAQVTFFLQHLPLVAAVVALLGHPAVRRSRVAGWALRVAMAGLVLLALVELAAISAHDVALHSDHGDFVNNLYIAPMTLMGVGFVVGGIALLRGGTEDWAGARWLPALVLLLGVWLFVPMGLVISDFVGGRLAIGSWMLLFALLGYAMTRVSSAATRG
jgi:hypothetical protein